MDKRNIRIYEAMYKEHGLEEALRRLSNIFNLDFEGEYVSRINFTEDSIYFNCNHPVKVTIYDEYYTVTKQFLTYRTINYYDTDKNLFRKSTLFDTPEDDILGVDAFVAEQLDSLRIVKTTKDDQHLENPYFERERMTVADIPIEEVSKYTEYSNDDSEISKEIQGLGNNYYYHVYSLDEESRFLETAACLDTPKFVLEGRVRGDRDLLYYAEHNKYPNIQFRGSTSSNGSYNSFFDITITKIKEAGLFSIQIDIVNQLDGSSKHYSHLLTNQSKGPISIIDLNNLMYFLYHHDYDFKHYIIEEIRRLRDKMDKKQLDLDGIELQMMMNPDYDHLAFHIYENLDAYNEKIKEISHRELSEERKKLMS